MSSERFFRYGVTASSEIEGALFMRTHHPATKVSAAIAARPRLRARCANLLKDKMAINVVRSVETPADTVKAVIQLTPDIVLIE